MTRFISSSATFKSLTGRFTLLLELISKANAMCWVSRQAPMVAGNQQSTGRSVLTELKYRGVRDSFFIVCDGGFKSLPKSVNAVFPLATIQTCLIHPIRGTFRYASRKYWDQISRDLKPIYTAPTPEAALAAFEQFEETWAARYPAKSTL